MDDKNPIFRSLAMIEEKILEKLTVEILAEGVHFSKYHYQRIFRETVGCTVMGYVARRRLSLAAKELAATQASVLEIALKYGYESHEGFTRSFKAYLGVTPTEYRKYHSAIGSPHEKKEECAMMHAKNTDEMIREWNSLIVQAKEAAAAARKYHATAASCTQVWAFASKRAEKMADGLKEILERVTALTQHPDEISARFLIVKAAEDTAFEASITAFQVGLMAARALPEHRAALKPLCGQYNRLAQNARIKSEKMVDFFNELSALIFHDMRNTATHMIQTTAEAGMAAAEKLSDPVFPYGYLADGIQEIAEELHSIVLEDVTLSFLENAVFRMETVLFAADMELLHTPQRSQLLESISDFHKKLAGVTVFFQNLSADGLKAFAEMPKNLEMVRTERKQYNDLAVQEKILLFYLKGEIQNLRTTHPDTNPEMEPVCRKIGRAIELAQNMADKKDADEAANLLHEAYHNLKTEAERLGIYGGSIAYLAEEINKPLEYCCERHRCKQ